MTIRQLGKPTTMASLLGVLTSIPLAFAQTVTPSAPALKPEQDIKLETNGVEIRVVGDPCPGRRRP